MAAQNCSLKHHSFIQIFIPNIIKVRQSLYVTIVACRTAGQQIKWTILHLGHVPTKIHLISPDCPQPSMALHIYSTQSWLKTPFPNNSIMRVFGTFAPSLLSHFSHLCMQLSPRDMFLLPLLQSLLLSSEPQGSNCVCKCGSWTLLPLNCFSTNHLPSLEAKESNCVCKWLVVKPF